MTTSTTQPIQPQTEQEKDFQALLRTTLQTRNATRFIAWVAGIFALLSVIAGVYGVVLLVGLSNAASATFGVAGY